MPGAVALRSGANPRSKPKSAAAAPEPGTKKKGSERRSGPNPGTRPPESGRFDASGAGSCSSDSSCDRGSAKVGGARRKNAARAARVAPEGSDAAAESPSITKEPSLEKKRCSWITPYSDPLYVTFHDKEWGTPVFDDRKLFELLILSQALAELSWPTILKEERHIQLFDDFDHSSIAKFTEKKIILLRSSSSLLSEQKIRAAVENARLIKKIIEEFGSFSNYCWNFVCHKPIVNGFRYTRQVPVKSPKAEAISKDLMQRGFRCVGPTIIYSFMQAAGIVNDHLSSCFRFKACENHTRAAEVKKSIAAMSLTEA
uniref:GMP synthase n=1 Tax=Ananas comosus var. bracteatus TaxID=296719 RepID=A0A6V7PNI9_ANACO|nr:unnamed protein product [Ananas comosus var. bracteatus]